MVDMNRRNFARIALAIPVVLTGCKSEPKLSHTATLLDNEAVHEAFKELEESMEGLEMHVGEFDTENWHEVVPEVKDAATGLRNGIDQLKRVLGYPVSN
jgi:hypothetical protein